jgi:hypothetical protein
MSPSPMTLVLPPPDSHLSGLFLLVRPLRIGFPARLFTQSQCRHTSLRLKLEMRYLLQLHFACPSKPKSLAEPQDSAVHHHRMVWVLLILRCLNQSEQPMVYTIAQPVLDIL